MKQRHAKHIKVNLSRSSRWASGFVKPDKFAMWNMCSDWPKKRVVKGRPFPPQFKRSKGHQ